VNWYQAVRIAEEVINITPLHHNVTLHTLLILLCVKNWVLILVPQFAVLKLTVLEQIHSKVMEVKLSLFLMMICYNKHTSDIVHCLEFSSNMFLNHSPFPSPDVRKEEFLFIWAI
jgi:hypothetical protein